LLTLTRHFEIQSLKLSDHTEGSLRVGAGPSMIKYITRIILFLMCGGSPSACKNPMSTQYEHIETQSNPVKEINSYHLYCCDSQRPHIRERRDLLARRRRLCEQNNSVAK
jgi:hypothetical protein